MAYLNNISDAAIQGFADFQENLNRDVSPLPNYTIETALIPAFSFKSILFIFLSIISFQNFHIYYHYNRSPRFHASPKTTKYNITNIAECQNKIHISSTTFSTTFTGYCLLIKIAHPTASRLAVVA
jgi:hypothetical protein